MARSKKIKPVETLEELASEVKLALEAALKGQPYDTNRIAAYNLNDVIAQVESQSRNRIYKQQVEQEVYRISAVNAALRGR